MIKYKHLILILISIVLSACFGSPGSVPEDRFYTLIFNTSAIVVKKYNRISIKKVRAYGVYNERTMLYANADLPLQVKRYHYHHWVMSPTKLIQHGLKDYLTQSRIADEVLVHEVSQIGILRISVELLALERIVNKGQAMVHVELAFNIHKPDGHFKSYNFEKKIKTKRNTIHSAAEAYGVALTHIFRDFLKVLIVA